MGRIKGGFNFSNNYELSINAPIDARMRTGFVSELTSLPARYNGMIVSVVDETTDASNGLYICKDNDNGLWEQVGTSITIDTELSSTSTNPLTNAQIHTELSGKQNSITSSTNIEVNDINFTGTLKKDGTQFSYNDLDDKPSLFSGVYADLTSKPSLFSGVYADLTSKPSLFSGVYADLTSKPSLFSGSYNDLTDKPSSLPTITGTGGTTSSKYLRINADGTGAEWAYTGVPSALLSISSSQSGKVLKVDSDGDAEFSHPTKSNWNENSTSSAAYIQNKPDINAIQSDISTLQSAPQIVACCKLNGEDGTFDRQTGFTSVSRDAVGGTYAFVLSSTAQSSDYIVNAIVIESDARDDIIVQLKTSTQTTTGFTLLVHEGDNAGTAGNLRDRNLLISVIDY